MHIIYLPSGRKLTLVGDRGAVLGTLRNGGLGEESNMLL